MSELKTWLLPDGVFEALPEEARKVEFLRRQLFDLYATWGYELVIPPLIEYLDALLVGTAFDLDLQTLKVTDAVSGRQLGIRADITPQVARLDAHQLKREVPTRLCYYGRVLHARPDGFGGSRSPLQIGAELYGHQGVASDREILTLMVETLRLTEVPDFHLDLGHVGIFRTLARQANLDQAQEQQLIAILQRKAEPELHELLAKWQIAPKLEEMFARLIWLNGDCSVLEEAAQALGHTDHAIQQALAELAQLVEQVDCSSFHIDLAELRGYQYHTGAIFSAYIPGHGEAVANGGRYDHIGEYFGRQRPATGFSSDLHTLVAIGNASTPQIAPIFAPAQDDVSLHTMIAQLRAQGEIVICALPGDGTDARALGCLRSLTRNNHAQWQVVTT